MVSVCAGPWVKGKGGGGAEELRRLKALNRVQTGAMEVG